MRAFDSSFVFHSAVDAMQVIVSKLLIISPRDSSLLSLISISIGSDFSNGWPQAALAAG